MIPWNNDGLSERTLPGHHAAINPALGRR